jgi:N-acetylglucosamine malate deacetylase 1
LSTVLVVAPHPDDETLGCGGTLLRHKAEGDTINWLIMTSISEKNGFKQDRIERRSNEIINVREAYDFTQVHQASFDTTMLDSIPKAELVAEVSTFIHEAKPDILYLPYRNDVHSDHEIVFDTAVSCTKSFRYPFIRKIRVYETLSETEFGLRPEDGGFRPNFFVDISGYLDKKIEIMKHYEGELGEHPFPRSEKNIRALSTLRGATVGVMSAEAFMSLKEIW